MLDAMKRNLRNKRERTRRNRPQLDPNRLCSVVGGVVPDQDEEHTPEQLD